MQNFFNLDKHNWKAAVTPVMLAMLFSIGYLLAFGIAYGSGNEALAGVKSVKALIDFRTGNPQKALVYLTLIDDTFNDRNIQAVTAHPDFVINFGGESVKLFAKDGKGYSTEEQKTIDQIKDKITAMAKEGIEFDYCAYGGKLFGVDPTKVSGVGVVDNGWVSLVGYQARGYSLLAAY